MPSTVGQHTKKENSIIGSLVAEIICILCVHVKSPDIHIILVADYEYVLILMLLSVKFYLITLYLTSVIALIMHSVQFLIRFIFRYQFIISCDHNIMSYEMIYFVE